MTDQPKELPKDYVPTAMKALPCPERSFHWWTGSHCGYCALSREKFDAAYDRRRKWIARHPEFREPRNKRIKESDKARAESLEALLRRAERLLQAYTPMFEFSPLGKDIKQALGESGVGA